MSSCKRRLMVFTVLSCAASAASADTTHAASSVLATDDTCDTADGSGCAFSALQRSKDFENVVHPDMAKPTKATKPTDQLADQAFIQFDGKTVTVADRKELNSGFAKEILFQFPMQPGMKVDGDKIRIDNNVIVQADYARDSFQMRRTDYGVLKTLFFKNNPNSMFSDKIVGTMFEKTHTLFFNNTASEAHVPHATADRVRWHRFWHPVGDFVSAWAPIRYVKHLLSTAFVGGGFARQVISAGKDYNHQAAMREHVTDANLASKPFSRDNAAMERMRGELNQRAADAKTHGQPIDDPLESSVACIHFEHIPGMVIEESYMEIPLKKKIVTYRGRMSFAPNEEYNLGTGYSIWTHNTTTDTLDFYMAVSSSLDIKDTPHGQDAIFAIGHADGESTPIVPEGRQIDAGVSQPWLFHLVWKLNEWLPGDYKFMYKNRKDVGCPDSELASFDENSDKIDKLLTTDDNTMMDNLRLVKLLTDSVPCSIEYLRPDFDDATSFDVWEAMGFSHFMMEVPPNQTHLVLAQISHWNRINSSLMHVPT